MRISRNSLANFLISCRDLSDVIKGAPILVSVFRGQEPVTLQKTSRGVLRKIKKESRIYMECRVRCVRLSHWILVSRIGNDERLALSKRGQVSLRIKFVAQVALWFEQWNQMDLSIGASSVAWKC
jgi:hypothetical protein